MDALDRQELYVGGGWRLPTDRGTVDLVSPHTEDTIAQAPVASAADVDLAVAAARKALDVGPWHRLDPTERIDVIRVVADRYAERMAEIAAVVTTEMGAPITFARRA